MASPDKKHIVVLSGAGISAESGLKTFRDSDGLWEGYDVMEVATPEGWNRDPGMVLDFYNKRRQQVRSVQPNAAHFALAELESHYKVTIITQNIDNLHEKAGSSQVMHLHGEILKSRSSVDYNILYEQQSDIKLGDLCEKGSQLRPHVVWFGEPVYMIEPAALICKTADIFIVVGTSLVVYPAAGLVHYTPSDIPNYLVDPNIPYTKGIRDFKVIKSTATIGVPQLVKSLLSSL